MAQLAQELAAFGRVVGLAGGQPTRYGRASIPGHQMNLGGPSRAGLADGVRAVFLAPPVHPDAPSPAVRSNATASILRRTI